MPIGWIASRDVSAFVVEAIFNTNLKAESFQISGLENLKGDDVAKGIGKKVVYHTLPAKEFGEILKPFVGEEGAAGVASFYEELQNSNEYPSKFNPNMQKVLEKLPIQMTSLEQWAREHKKYFSN
ncbi:hypothetical protein ACMC56_07660 [Campylobacterota bacterium DY0563]